MPDANLDRLLTVAHRQGGDPDLIWPAALAAIGLLLWHDDVATARDLAVETIARFGCASGRLAAQTTPLTDALVATGPSDGEVAALLAKAAEDVAADSVLGKHLRWVIDQLPGRDPREFALGAQWQRPRRALRPRDQAFAQRDLATLAPAERDRLWKACHSAGEDRIALELLDKTGEHPPRPAIATWLVGCLVRDGELDRARGLLREAARRWRPSLVFEVAPYTFMVQPLLRAAVTDETRAVVEERIDISTVPGIEP